MFGLEGAGVYWAYLLCILSALLCIVYGIVNWNKPAENENPEIKEEAAWEEADTRIAEKL